MISEMTKIERLGRIAEKMHFRSTLEKTGLFDFAKSVAYKKSLKVAERYYREHQYEIEMIFSKLSDEESKKVFEHSLKYTSTFKKKWHIPVESGEQYFIPQIIDFIKSRKTTFIDCGAFTGDTISVFLDFASDSFERVYAFEPDKDNFSELEKKYSNDDRFELINAGVWDINTELVFYTGNQTSSKFDSASTDATRSLNVDKNHPVYAPVKSIDEICNGQNIFIKMDIEGAEMKGLKGAEKLIESKKPILAICLYVAGICLHSIDDMPVSAVYGTMGW